MFLYMLRLRFYSPVNSREEFSMKRMIIMMLLLSLALCGAAFAQDDAGPAGKGAKGLKAMDTNGDGKISKEEFMDAAKKRAEARFQKLDANGDGYITKDELDAAKAKRGERAGKKGAEKAPQ